MESKIWYAPAELIAGVTFAPLGRSHSQ